MMNNYPTKNGLLWTSIYKFPQLVDPVKLARFKKWWSDIDWGEHYENNRRDSRHNPAIYPDTRGMAYKPDYPTRLSPEIVEAIDDMVEDVKRLFPIPVTLLYSELNLLVPNGQVSWHHDRLLTASLSTRVMIPLTDNTDIKYYLCSWRKDTPEHDPLTSPLDYMDEDVVELEMQSGFYYSFNHRAPHRTDSRSTEPRGILMLDMIPSLVTNNEYYPLTEFERTRLIPTNVYLD